MFDIPGRTRFAVLLLAAGALSLGHAALTWPPAAVLLAFGAGSAIAFLAELLGVRLGLFVHRLRPRIAGVPLPIVVGWTAAVYLPYRTALLAVGDGAGAAVAAATLAVVTDALVDPIAVRRGLWRYPQHPLSTRRFRGVPLWNFLAWFVLVAGVAWLVGGAL